MELLMNVFMSEKKVWNFVHRKNVRWNFTQLKENRFVEYKGKRWDVSDLDKGIYILKAINSDGIVKNTKFSL